MKFSRFGSEKGRVVVYFHGAPGAPDECSIFDRYGKEHDLSFICFDRFAADTSIAGESYYRLLAEEILKHAAGKQVDVIGFSLGAFIALQTYLHMAVKVLNLHLISAAAPLEAVDFLDAMAGEPIFRLAKKFPVLFVLLSYWQALLALFVPDLLFRLLFAEAAGDDKVLAADSEFQSGIIKLLRSCFIGRVQGYLRDTRAYVRPWQTTLSEVSVKTHIWHGAEDNWSPKSMAEYLASAIPGCKHAEILDGLSHYSCLYKTVPMICRQLNET